MLYAEADAKQREDAAKKKYKRNVYREGSINETKMINPIKHEDDMPCHAKRGREMNNNEAEPNLPNTTSVMDLVKQRVRQLDAMELEPDDGRLAVKEKYTILATVAMEEVEDEMGHKVKRASHKASPRTPRRSTRLAARDRAEDKLARMRLTDAEPMGFEVAHRPVGGEVRQRSRVAYASKTKEITPPQRLVTYGAGRIPSNKIEYFNKTDPTAHGSVAAQRRRSPRNRSWGGVPANNFRTPERKVLSFNSPGAPERANARFSGGGSGGGARRRNRACLRGWNPAIPHGSADKEAQTDPPVTPRSSWSWSSAIWRS